MSKAISIDVLDLGINNISSVVSGIRATSRPVDVNVVTRIQEVSTKPSLTVLPGNGSFGAGMAALKSTGLGTHLSRLSNSGGPIFGICLGLQLLFDSSEESPGVQGLGLISGKVRRLPIIAKTGVQTNIGWSSLFGEEGSDSDLKLGPLLRDFYFVHSYVVEPEFQEDVILESTFDNVVFPAAVRRGRTIGVQFHPEKSSNSGIEMLESVLGWALAKD